MPNEPLRDYIHDMLGGALGLSVVPAFRKPRAEPAPKTADRGPMRSASEVAGLYFAAFCVVPWMVQSVTRALPDPIFWDLFVLQVYGSFWSGWATLTTKITSTSIWPTIERDIIPALPGETADAILEDLRPQFDAHRLLRASWAIALVAAALAWRMIYHDVGSAAGAPMAQPAALLVATFWWSAGWAILFATSAKVVMVSRFYRVLAARLEDIPGTLYPMDPARSALIISVASVAQRMLLFWFGIAASIALAIPFSINGWKNLSPHSGHPGLLHLLGAVLAATFDVDLEHNQFVLIDVVVTGFFSIGVGTAIFLASEAAIRRAVIKVTRSTLLRIEAEVADLAGRLEALDEAGWKRLNDLNALHDSVAKTSSYRSFIFSGLSLLAPLVPIAGLFIHK